MLFTLFGLKLDRVNVETHNFDAYFESAEFESEVRQKSGLNQNTSVFFINKKQVISTLEKQFPFVQVINIETTFPNGLIIHIAKREAIFALPLGNNQGYFLVDKDFKVLQIIDKQTFETTSQTAILLEGVAVDNQTAAQGDFLQLTEHQKLLSSLARAFLVSGRSVVEQKALFEKIEISTDNVREYLTNDDKTVVKLVLQDGFEVFVYSPHTYLTEKISLMFSALPEVYPLYQNTHFLEIFEKLDNSLFCKLSLKN